MPCMAGERPAERRAENADDNETGFVSRVRVAPGYTSTLIRWRWSSKIAPGGARLTAAPSFISPADGVASLSRFHIVQENRMRRGATAALLLAIFFLAPVRVRAQEMVVGVNVVNPMRASVADQNTLLSQLKAAQVPMGFTAIRPLDNLATQRPRRNAQPASIASISLNAVQKEPPEANPAGSPNGDSRTPTCLVRPRKPAARS